MEAAYITSATPLAAYSLAFTRLLPDGGYTAQKRYILNTSLWSLYRQASLLQTLQAGQPKPSQPHHWDLEHRENIGRICLINLTDRGKRAIFLTSVHPLEVVLWDSVMERIYGGIYFLPPHRVKGQVGTIHFIQLWTSSEKVSTPELLTQAPCTVKSVFSYWVGIHTTYFKQLPLEKCLLFSMTIKEALDDQPRQRHL